MQQEADLNVSEKQRDRSDNLPSTKAPSVRDNTDAYQSLPVRDTLLFSLSDTFYFLICTSFCHRSFHPQLTFLSAPPQAYPLSSLPKKQPTVLVICGPDQNGSIGLVCARHLRIFVQLINDAYNLVIDAMLGAESDPTNVKEPYCGILCTLKQVKIPIASVDVPSGWDVEEPSQDGIHPEVLISLIAPKKCSMSFSGKHFLAGRFLPYDIQKKYELNLPDYPGTDCLIEL
uniref:YjeF N-terminal domain containing 3 n=1 Tax=Cynoglossus semilaevis TaxID=244447 RepID=A0A3P8V770_CYNSE